MSVSGTLRIAIIGLAGCGKSTTAAMVARYGADAGLSCAAVKLAEPLYALQEQVYLRAGVAIRAGAQDQVLMEALADAMRRIRPASLADDFLARLTRTTADVVINDDLRDPYVDAVVLRDNGFRVLRVTASPEVREQRLAARGDLSRADRSTGELDLIEPDAVLDNSGSLASHRASVHRLIGSWL
jgi:dephospho-CoA kinase